MKAFIMKVFAFLFLVLFGLSVSKAPNQSRKTFGLNIGFQANGNLVSYAGIVTQGNNITALQVLTKEEFILYASGFWPSRFNPTQENLFEKYNIFGGVFIDSLTKQKIPYCPVLDIVWRVGFHTHPNGNSSISRGWANELYRPSRNQCVYLDSTYGLKGSHYSYVIDTNFWKFLHDIQDTNWQINYKKL